MTKEQIYKALDKHYFSLPDNWESKDNFHNGYATGFADAVNILECLIYDCEKRSPFHAYNEAQLRRGEESMKVSIEDYFNSLKENI